MDIWVFINRLTDFLDDKSLMNLSGTNKLLYTYINERCIWKRRCLKYNIINIEKIHWKDVYIKCCPIYVNPKTTKHNIEYKDHPTGCFTRVLSSKDCCLEKNTSYIISDLDLEYYIIKINETVSLVKLHIDNNEKKYYKQNKILKSKIFKCGELFNIKVYIKNIGSLAMPFKKMII